MNDKDVQYNELNIASDKNNIDESMKLVAMKSPRLTLLKSLKVIP